MWRKVFHCAITNRHSLSLSSLVYIYFFAWADPFFKRALEKHTSLTGPQLPQLPLLPLVANCPTDWHINFILHKNVAYHCCLLNWALFFLINQIIAVKMLKVSSVGFHYTWITSCNMCNNFHCLYGLLSVCRFCILCADLYISMVLSDSRFNKFLNQIPI